MSPAVATYWINPKICKLNAINRHRNKFFVSFFIISRGVPCRIRASYRSVSFVSPSNLFSDFPYQHRIRFLLFPPLLAIISNRNKLVCSLGSKQNRDELLEINDPEIMWLNIFSSGYILCFFYATHCRTILTIGSIDDILW